MSFTRVLGPGIHTASNINSHNINSTGIITAVSFVGNGAGLTGIASTDNIITGTAATFNTYPVDINAGMDVVGVSSFQDIDVDGHTNLDNVSVAGVTTFNNNAHFKLNDKLYFGNNNELEIYQQGNNSFIKNNDDTFIIMQGGSATNYPMKIYGGNEFQLRHYHSNGGQNSVFTSVRGGAFTLYHAAPNTPSAEHVRLETTSTGLNFPRDIDVDGHTNLDNVSIAGVTTFSDSSRIIDDKKLLIGNGSDLQLYHQSSNNHSIIQETGTGNLYIAANDLYLTTAGLSESYLIAQRNAGVQLNYDNSNRFETTSVGVSIPQDLDVDGHTNLDNVSIAGVTTFSGGISGTTANFSGNVTVGGVLTYEDVKNVDSVGIATARVGIKVLAGGVEIDGGGLDVVGVTTTTDDIIIGADNKKLKLGAGGELELYQSGNHSIIKHNGIHSLLLQSNAFRVMDSAATKTIIYGDPNGQSSLYYNGSKKLETINSGVDITGILQVDGIHCLGPINLDSDIDVDGHTNLDNLSVAGVSTFSGNINLPDSVSAVFGTDDDGSIKHTGANLQIFETTGNIQITNYANDKDVVISSDDGSGGTANYFVADGSTGKANLYYYGGLKLETNVTGVRFYGHSQPTVNNSYDLGASSLNWRTVYAKTGDFSGDLDVDGHTNLDNVSIAGVTTFPDATGTTGRLYFGNDQDMQLWHSGNDGILYSSTGGFYIGGFGTGGITLQANKIRLRNGANNEDMIECTANGAVEVYYDNSKKLETSEKGIKVGTGVTIETNGQATYTGIITATAFKLADGSAIGAGAGGTWSTYTAGIATSKSVGVNTSTLDDNDLVGVGNSFQGLYISNGMIIHDNTLSGNHYIGTAFNGLMAGPVNIEGTLSVDGSYVVV